jgi:hypothetical protein
MMHTDLRKAVKVMRDVGSMASAAVGCLVGWNSTPSFGIAAGLALMCVVGGFEVLAWCAIAMVEKDEAGTRDPM